MPVTAIPAPFTDPGEKGMLRRLPDQKTHENQNTDKIREDAMTPELTILAWNAVLLIVMIMASANANLMAMGMAWGIGNRDEPATVTGWGARARRAYLNQLENLLIFAVFVVVAHLANVHSSLTVLGAQLFLIARLVYAVLYIGGVSVLGVRTAAYFVGLVGTLMIAYAVLTASPVPAA
jgi:uncharacterized MAPEG superfamily protein